MVKSLLLASIALLSFGVLNRACANVVIAIDQTGGNDPVAYNNPRTWNFGITAEGASYFSANGITFDSAIFDAKVHKRADNPLVFTLYSGLGGNVAGNTVLATVSHAASEFNNQYGGTAARLFSFTGLNLDAGYYSVTITSTASANPNDEYFLKIGKLTLQNTDGTTLASSLWLQDQGTGSATGVFNGTGSINPTSVMVPEPNAVWAVLAIAAVSLGGSLLPRLQRKPALAGVLERINKNCSHILGAAKAVASRLSLGLCLQTQPLRAKPPCTNLRRSQVNGHSFCLTALIRPPHSPSNS